MKTDGKNAGARTARTVICAAGFLVLTVIAVCGGCVFLRHLGDVIGRLPIGKDIKETLVPIFSQLRDARVAPKCVIPALLLLIPSLLIFFFPPKGKGRIFAGLGYALLVAVCLLLAFLFVVLFSKVNGIRFYDVLRSLIGLIRNGILDNL